jgi:hypothetical protein
MDVYPGSGIDTSIFASPYGASWMADDSDLSMLPSAADPWASISASSYPDSLPAQATTAGTMSSDTSPAGPTGSRRPMDGPSDPRGGEAPNADPAQDASGGAEPAGSVESGWSAITQFLQGEFASLERQLSNALQSLFQSAPPPSATPAPPVQHAGASQAPSQYSGLIQRAAEQNELDPALLTAVMRQESGFQADARSPAGAMGLMQLMPDTAKSLGVADPFDPEQSIDGGARLLRSLIDRFGGRLDLALAAYNAGPAAVERYGGVPPFAETQAYVHDIMADYRSTAMKPSA